MNNVTLAPVPDGVEDADSTSTQCTGWSNDAFEGPFRCVNISPPQPGTAPTGFCVPGSNFNACAADADCPNGETCQLMTVGGVTGMFCMQAPEDSVPIASACNHSPLEDDFIGLCGSGLCFGIGCSAFCSSNADCPTYDQGCDTGAGTCIDDPQIACTDDTDCSAWECSEMQLFSDDPTEFPICFGKSCFSNKDCGDSDFFCDLYGNYEEGMDVNDFNWVPSCGRRPEGSVDVGAACDEDPDDNIPGDECHSGFCMGGYCSALCSSDADCAVDMGQRCVIYEWDLDFDDDGESEHYELLGLCYTIGSIDAESPVCTSQADCPADTTCSMYAAGDYTPGTGGNSRITGVCEGNNEAELGYLEACGIDDAQICQGEGWLYQCFDADETQARPGYCSYPCRSSADCPDGVHWSGEEVHGVCSTYYYSYNGTLDDQSDDLFINFCAPESIDSSLEDCSATKACTEDPEHEFCYPNQIIYNPDEGALVEYYCTEVFDEDNPKPTGQLGDACTDSGECATLLCNNPKELAGAGYCGALCNVDDDCAAGGADMVCEPEVWLDRPGDEHDMIVPNCMRAASCIDCLTDGDCAGGYLCTNIGTGAAANMVCARPCATGADCRGSACEAALDADDTARAEMVCTPSCGE